ncbi:23S rRNA (uracil(1939)-C(5))-methyltransferase RlmD [Vallitalea pronyensis]|uniref:23S rRNA (Uracil(1939)-C(5))-methyltransferase RlmD n=1 Tax=Vallitalea pronyensis TaxID=1348613 RepID=A0A8J8SJ92_9FIRM|nr:23S rRNA (uracil(1939)-C(5))-methyltransferase RlmD [Vallitalea pronyensis]QUI25421.1 23S rRNA (uracil(1939)-C(5))-methyltransferase RlmD [Vallitalea pronyensis]
MKKNNQALPVVKNEYYHMTIDDLGIHGEGIGKINGYTLFVDGALPGEKVKVKVIKTKKNYGYGKLIEIVKPSEHRRDPVCPIAKRCGGCQIQHLSYKAQLAYKRKKIVDLLERIGGMKDVVVNETIGMDDPYYYRNKVQFPVGEAMDGGIDIGFYAMRSHQIVTTDTCYIQQPVNGTIIETIKAHMLTYGIPPYSEHRHQGLVRHIVTRISHHTNEIMVGIVINGHKLPHEEELVTSLQQIEQVSGIYVSMNKEKTNVIMGKTIRMLWGQETITDYIGAIAFRISPLSFYQVNPIQTEKLYNMVLAYADLTGEEVVWDAYCGIGTISLFLAKHCKKVLGVEIVPEAIQDAKENARLSGITNAEFHVGKAERVITEQFQDGVKADVIVVDPPRKGCDKELLDTIIAMEPKRVVYVSCDPGTMARDVRVLCDGGYAVREVQGVDMFPHTVHTETICLLKNSKSSDYLYIDN